MKLGEARIVEKETGVKEVKQEQKGFLSEEESEED